MSRKRSAAFFAAALILPGIALAQTAGTETMNSMSGAPATEKPPVSSTNSMTTTGSGAGMGATAGAQSTNPSPGSTATTTGTGGSMANGSTSGTMNGSSDTTTK